MCTVIIDVPTDPGTPVRLLAIRDEDPNRPWNPLGHWWPEHPSILGVQDIRAGGAWLATDADTRRLAVLLNRAGGDHLPDTAVLSRGTLPLDSVLGHSPDERPAMRGFNLLEVDATSARVISWDGAIRRETEIEPGIHMIAHDDVDDPATARISHWLEHFRLAAPDARPADGTPWYQPWLDVLARSAELGPVDDRAIIRDNRPLGYPTLSLLVCAASVGTDAVDIRYADLPAPGTWGDLDLH
ncbi:NRDE family protein [Microbacterium schleiferi]|uniref:NRDE family protein n=1 Tax=Microbacterium schleiferi TaxID=69362 RepID=A0A7S8MYE9_9MICO|nr:NRDE family protein [Microbacterium schleiferi]QPE04983.1 NRDE family protein [Microbacterium schleiferi]